MPNLPCQIPDCDRPVKGGARGWCFYHYHQWWRTGDPIPKRQPTPLERYWGYVDTSGGPDACWPWTGHIRHGYGQMRVGNKKQVPAHRWGYEQRVGPIPEGHGVLHRCDNPPCQNDRHWFTGTHADNMADKMAKGRQRNVRGDEHPSAVLSAEQVRAIRTGYAAGGVKYADLARQFSTSKSNIASIINRTTWQHVA